jgi:serine/threonine protein kinase
VSAAPVCPDFAELEEHAAGETQGPRASWIGAHASSCGECANALSEIRADRDLESRLQRAFAPDEVPAPRALPVIEGYRILSELGRGGMGVVYEAEQLEPARRVALKVVRGAQYVDATTLKLFQREIRVLARLEHPGIASLYDAGSTGSGEHYFAMELVRGTSLVQHARELDRRACLGLFLQLCAAIEFAHQHGVVHRDLKPSNVLVTAAGRVKVLDFGLAKITDHDVAQTSLVTEAGQIRGTLAYMSPEQARGDPSAIDLRSDVYSLGVVLYQLCTQKLPTDVFNVHIHEAARRICEEAPKRPSSIDASLRGDLETIVLKALEKDSTRRYASAAALAEDVRRFLADEVILARRPSTAYELKKLVARHTVAFALASTIFVLALGTTVWTTILYEKESELRLEPTRRAWRPKRRAPPRRKPGSRLNPRKDSRRNKPRSLARRRPSPRAKPSALDAKPRPTSA